MKFEDKIKEIEKLANELDNSNTSLDRVLEIIEMSKPLIADCREFLEKAEQKITTL
jgi:exodeoxyribonuclease VII small subunit